MTGNRSIHIGFVRVFTLLLAVVLTLSSTSTTAEAGRRLEAVEGTVKTIKGDDGELVDCVDIYKQPSLNHPHMKGHNIQMEPSTYPNTAKRNSSSKEGVQSWHRYGKCPHGTIPIHRRSSGVVRRGLATAEGPHFEYALVTSLASAGTKYYGIDGKLNVWNPFVSTAGDVSASKVMVSSGKGASQNIAQAGWAVYPAGFGDYKTRIFVQWTRDGFHSTGCVNLDCSGFVQVNNDFSLDAPISATSTQDGTQYEIRLTIFQDKSTGHWWVRWMGETYLGYFPASLFTSLSKGADSIAWGGVVYDSSGNSEHTSTDMGSGRFPSLGYKKACYIRNIKYVDGTNTLRTPHRTQLGLAVTKPLCYNVEIPVAGNPDPNWGLYFFFGGSGRNSACS